MQSSQELRGGRRDARPGNPGRADLECRNYASCRLSDVTIPFRSPPAASSADSIHCPYGSRVLHPASNHVWTKACFATYEAPPCAKAFKEQELIAAVVEHRLNSVAFPVLDTGQIAQLTSCTTVARKHYGNGEALIGVGDRSFRFFVVKSGEIEVIDYSSDESRAITTHRTGEFTGDISRLTGTPTIFSAIARGDSEVFEISGEALRHVLNQCPALGDIIRQAFIARRQLLRESPDFTGLRVIGSRYSPDTFRIRDFLSRNRVLFTWLDLESDPQVDQLLKQFAMTEADTPMAACAHDIQILQVSNEKIRRLVLDMVAFHCK